MSGMGEVSGGKLIDVPGERRVDAARRRYSEWRVDDLEGTGDGLIVDRGSGALFRIVTSEVLEAKDRAIEVAGFFVSDDNEPVFFRREEGTLAELRQWQEQARRDEEQTREREQTAHAAFLAAQPRVPVTFADLEGQPLPTLRAAALEIEASGGELKVTNGRLIVLLPERLHERPVLDQERRAELLRYVRVLHAASDLVVEAIERGGRKPLCDRLPDAPVLVGGGCES